VSGVVVVTGAAGGIGRAIADATREAGYDVVGVDLAERPADLPGTDRWVRADLTDPDGVVAVVDAAGEAIAGVVNCAGITRDATLPDLTDAAISLVLDVNAVAAARLCEALAPAIRDGGSVVNIASRAHLGNIGQVNYAASKGAVVGLSRALARRLAPRVRVNAVAPGLIATDMTAAMPERVLDKLVSRVPAARMGTPAEVADEVVALLGPSTGYVTGQVRYVCGGRSL
jgi:NAD(P)-dependent dehydrogenase (short-subunit alcohol dehydrogenase family)